MWMWKAAALFCLFCLADIPRLLGLPLLVIEGQVVDQTGKPVSGARVLPKGGTRAGAVVTTMDGKFRLELAQGQGVIIVVEASGFATAQRSVSASDSGRTVVVTLAAWEIIGRLANPLLYVPPSAVVPVCGVAQTGASLAGLTVMA